MARLPIISSRRSLLPDVWRREAGMSPWRELSRLQRNMDRIFNDFFPSFPTLMGAEEETGFVPAADVEETDTQYIVSFDLPGVSKDEIQIQLRDNHLVVSGERKEERHRKEEGRALNVERYYGTFQREFPLPTAVDPHRVEANYQNGVLQIVISKTEAAKSKLVEIKEGKREILPKKEEKVA